MAPFDYKKEYDRYKRYYLSMEPVLTKPVNQAYTAIIFSFLAVSLFGWYAIRPTVQTIVTLKREIADKTVLNKQMEDKISALIEAQATFGDVEQNLGVITQALPTSSDPVTAIAQLQGLAQESNVTITALSLPSLPLSPKQIGKQQSPSPTIVSFVVPISVTGSYTDVKNFLQGIGNLRRIIQINSMVFAPRTARVSQATESATPQATGTMVTVDLKLTVYYMEGGALQPKTPQQEGEGSL